jgi:hypothetical protein
MVVGGGDDLATVWFGKWDRAKKSRYRLPSAAAGHRPEDAIPKTEPIAHFENESKALSLMKLEM